MPEFPHFRNRICQATYSSFGLRVKVAGARANSRDPGLAKDLRRVPLSARHVTGGRNGIVRTVRPAPIMQPRIPATTMRVHPTAPPSVTIAVFRPFATRPFRPGRVACAALLALMLGILPGGCGGLRPEPDSAQPRPDANQRDIAQSGSIFGKRITFGGDRDQDRERAPGGIAVNSYLWRASLDTVSFLPLEQVDAFGGVILTDWYAPPEAPDERFKLNIYILGRELRADGVRVSVFKQESRGIADDGGMIWQDMAVADGTAARLENAILTRARQLRIETSAQFDQ